MVRKLVIAFTMVFVISLTFVTNPNSSIAQVKGEVPGNTLGLKSDADLWRYIRTGNAGSTQMKDQLSAVMIQSEGDNWRAIRNGPVTLYGGLGLLAIIGVLFAFYMYRGKIKVDAGLSGDTILRFAAIDRFAHWLMAGSFVLLALTGLNLLYGKYVLTPNFMKIGYNKRASEYWGLVNAKEFAEDTHYTPSDAIVRTLLRMCSRESMQNPEIVPVCVRPLSEFIT